MHLVGVQLVQSMYNQMIVDNKMKMTGKNVQLISTEGNR